MTRWCVGPARSSGRSRARRDCLGTATRKHKIRCRAPCLSHRDEMSSKPAAIRLWTACQHMHTDISAAYSREQPCSRARTILTQSEFQSLAVHVICQRFDARPAFPRWKGRGSYQQYTRTIIVAADSGRCPAELCGLVSRQNHSLAICGTPEAVVLPSQNYQLRPLVCDLVDSSRIFVRSRANGNRPS